MSISRVVAENINEAISDSLAKVIREYDEATKDFSSGCFWKKKRLNEQAIEDLRKKLFQFSGGFLEPHQNLLESIREIINTRNSGSDVKDSNAESDKAFAYLASRLKYHDQKQRRIPDQLTAAYKILLIGDGWATQSDPDNINIKNINEELKSADEKIRQLGKMRLQHLDLQNRGFLPDQVYTVDRLSTRLPDLCGKIQEMKSNDLPNDYFDFVYLEGLTFRSELERFSAIIVAQTWLKNDGLILYHTGDGDMPLMLLSKLGEQPSLEELDKIPEYIQASANRSLLDYIPLLKGSLQAPSRSPSNR